MILSKADISSDIEDVLARIEQNWKWKRIHKANREMYKHRDKR